MVRGSKNGMVEEPELARTFLCCDMNKVKKPSQTLAALVGLLAEMREEMV